VYTHRGHLQKRLVDEKYRISDTYVEGYFSLPLNVVKHIVQSWQKLHVLVQLPSEFPIDLQKLWSYNELKGCIWVINSLLEEQHHPVVYRHYRGDEMWGFAWHHQRLS